MTAGSVSFASTGSKTGDCPFSAAPIVSAPSIGEAAAGSAVMRKKCSHAGTCSKPAWPSGPIGSSAVPWKQKYAFASESSRWYAISRPLSSTLSGTTTAPAFRMP